MTDTIAQERRDAYARQDAKNAALRLDSRARRLLAEASWNANREKLERVAAECDWIAPVHLEATVQRALELQADPAVRGRRVSVEEYEMAKKTGRRAGIRVFSHSERKAVRAYVRERLQEEPGVDPAELRQEVERKWDTPLQNNNWRRDYYVPACEELGIESRRAKMGRKPKAKQAKRAKPAEKPVSPRAATELPKPAPVESVQAGQAEAVSEPLHAGLVSPLRFIDAAPVRDDEERPMHAPAPVSVALDVATAKPDLSMYITPDGRMCVTLTYTTTPADAGALAERIGAALRVIREAA